jgi:hypothetical protein
MELRLSRYQNNKFSINKIKLSEKHSNAVFDARKKLLLILKMEELYDQVIESHLEFKKEIYGSSLYKVGSTRRSYIESHETRSKLNRLIFNTLNLSKIYLDKHFHNDKKKCFAREVTGNIKTETEIEHQRSKINQDNKYYKLGCQLRNITQHSTLPISTINMGSQRVDSQNGIKFDAHFNLPIERKILSSNKNLKTILPQFDDIIDLHEVMDGYVFGISQMHQLNRELIESTTKESVNVFKNLYKSVELEYGKHNYNVDVYEDDERLYSLELDWFDVVEYLQQKHAFTINHKIFNHSTYIPE